MPKVTELPASAAIGSADLLYGVAAGLSKSLPATLLAAPNLLINSSFDIWQRGASFSSLVADEYTADRWNAQVAGGSVNVSRQSFALGQTDVPGEPTYFARFDQFFAGADGGFAQRIEDVRRGAGQSVTVSLWAKAGASLTYTLRMKQNFGAAGSADVDLTTTKSLTTAWTLFSHTFSVGSITGKTIGAGSYLEFAIYDATSETHILDLAEVKCEIGAVATPLAKRPFGEEVALCQRYYEKTFPLETAPAQNAGRVGVLATIFDSTGEGGLLWQYKVQKRVEPTVVAYNPSALNVNWRNFNDGTDTSVFAETTIASEQRIFLYVATPTASDANDRMEIHATADAEI